MKRSNHYNPLYWIVQFVSWGMFCILLGMAKYIADDYDENTGIQLLFLYFLLIGSTQAIRYILLRMDWINFKIWELVPRALGLIIFISLIVSLLFSGFTHLLPEGKWQSSAEIFINVAMHSIFFILWTAVYLTYHLFQKSRIQELSTLRLQTRQTEMELKALRDQLNPHFLFNSLNNIRALIEIDPETAKSTLTTLSGLLRASLLLSKKTYISLQEELELVDNYLELEKIRYEERLNYEIKNDIDTQIWLPPFIIQGLVENAIKHGIARSTVAGHVIVHILQEEKNFIIKVRNTGVYKETSNKGIGIENTKRRLEILYGSDAGFEIQNKDGMVESILWIQKSTLRNKYYESDNN